MARGRKEKEPEPLPPPTHLPQTYDELVRSPSMGYVQGRPELDPFGFRQDTGSLRRDPLVLGMMVNEDDIRRELCNMVPRPDANIKLNMISGEIGDFSHLTQKFADMILFDTSDATTDKLPFFANTAENRAKRDAIREQAKNQTVNKKLKKSGNPLRSAVHLKKTFKSWKKRISKRLKPVKEASG